MYRSICTHCQEPVTLLLDRGRRRWTHDRGAVWPESHGHHAASTIEAEAVA